MSISNKFIVAILIIMISNYDYHCQFGNYHESQSRHKFHIMRTIIFNITCAVIIKNTNDGEEVVRQKLRNKIMHSMNGNRRTQSKAKLKTHLKTVTINKGSSNFETNKNAMLNIIENEAPDICVVTEANLEKDNPHVNTDFNQYEIESKYIRDNNLARIAVFISFFMVIEHCCSCHSKSKGFLKVYYLPLCLTLYQGLYTKI